MKKLKDIVRDLLTRHDLLKQWVCHGYDTSAIVERSRMSVAMLVAEQGLDISLEKQAKAIIREAESLPLTWEGIKPRPSLSYAVNDTSMDWAYHSQTSRFPHIKPSDLCNTAKSLLSSVQFQMHKGIATTQLKAVAKMTLEEREKRIPTRCLDEMDRAEDEVRTMHVSLNDLAQRMYAHTAGCFHPMWGKWDRARMQMPYSRKTSLAAHEAYCLREHKMTVEDIAKILEDEVSYLVDGGCPMAHAQAVSWYQISQTGETNILVYMDAVASGYAHQLAMLRDHERLLKFALPFRDGFMHPHYKLAKGLRQMMPALKVFVPSQLIPLSKFVFTPCMYTAGQKGLFSHATGGRSGVDEMYDGEEWRTVPMPPLINQLIGADMGEEERAMALWKLCGDFAGIFRRSIKRVPDMSQFWSGGKDSKGEWGTRDPEGLWVPLPEDGGKTLCPYLKRNKSETVEYTAKQWLRNPDTGKKEEVGTTVTCFKPLYDERGSATTAHVCQRSDAWTMAGAVVDSVHEGSDEPIIKVGVHDAAGFFLADESHVQFHYTDRFNRCHHMDLMRTGLAYEPVPSNEKFLR